MLIGIVEDEAHAERLLPILGETLTGGALVTMERVRVLTYAARASADRSNPGGA